jgi:hypothetical protein
LKNKGNDIIWLNVVVSILFFISYLSSGNKWYLFAILIVILPILIFTFKNKNYNPKLFYGTFLGIIILQGLLLTYFGLFEPIYIGIFFYAAICVFIFFVTFFTYNYLQKGRYSEPW